MANRALGAPRLTGPQPVSGQAVTKEPKDRVQSLITAGDSRRADAAFYYAMVACGLSVIAIVVLIVYELLFPQRVGPGQRSVRCPAFCLRHNRFFNSGVANRSPAGHRCRGLHYGDVPALAAGSLGLHD